MEWSQLLTRNNGEGGKNSKGADWSLFRQLQSPNINLLSLYHIKSLAKFIVEQAADVQAGKNGNARYCSVVGGQVNFNKKNL